MNQPPVSQLFLLSSSKQQKQSPPPPPPPRSRSRLPDDDDDDATNNYPAAHHCLHHNNNHNHSNNHHNHHNHTNNNTASNRQAKKRRRPTNNHHHTSHNESVVLPQASSSRRTTATATTNATTTEPMAFHHRHRHHRRHGRFGLFWLVLVSLCSCFTTTTITTTTTKPTKLLSRLLVAIFLYALVVGVLIHHWFLVPSLSSSTSSSLSSSSLSSSSSTSSLSSSSSSTSLRSMRQTTTTTTTSHRLSGNASTFSYSHSHSLNDNDTPLRTFFSQHNLLLPASPELSVSSSSLSSSFSSFSSSTSSSPALSLLAYPCAINLYGLPRSFKDLVLPSLIQNVLRPNARYRCDYFVHYHDRQSPEPPGRDGRGPSQAMSPPDAPDDVRFIEKHVHRIDQAWHGTNERREPIRVQFAKDTDESFWRARGDWIDTIKTARRRRSKSQSPVDHHQNNNNDNSHSHSTLAPLRYLPTNHFDFTNETIENIVKMWHGQQAVWDLMMTQETLTTASFASSSSSSWLSSFTNETIHASRSNRNNNNNGSSNHHWTPKHYSRVAMLRCDVVYVTPIDIYRIPSPPPSRFSVFGAPSHHRRHHRRRHWYDNDESSTVYDTANQYAVLPSFAKHPVNDRYIAGPFDAVRIWAASRFALLDRHIDHVIDRYAPGDGIHSERYVAWTILPAIRNAGIEIVEDDALCFLRARSDHSIRLDDCGVQHATRHNQRVVEQIIQRKCIRNQTAPNLVFLECAMNSSAVRENATGWRIDRGANDNGNHNDHDDDDDHDDESNDSRSNVNARTKDQMIGPLSDDRTTHLVRKAQSSASGKTVPRRTNLTWKWTAKKRSWLWQYFKRRT